VWFWTGVAQRSCSDDGKRALPVHRGDRLRLQGPELYLVDRSTSASVWLGRIRPACSSYLMIDAKKKEDVTGSPECSIASTVAACGEARRRAGDGDGDGCIREPWSASGRAGRAPSPSFGRSQLQYGLVALQRQEGTQHYVEDRDADGEAASDLEAGLGAHDDPQGDP